MVTARPIKNQLIIVAAVEFASIKMVEMENYAQMDRMLVTTAMTNSSSGALIGSLAAIKCRLPNKHSTPGLVIM